MVFHSLMQDWGELMLLSYSLTQSFMCRPSECLFGYNRQASDTRLSLRLQQTGILDKRPLAGM
jgi:hypothetical protein